MLHDPYPCYNSVSLGALLSNNMEDRLEFFASRPGGGCALGASGLTGRCWSGSVWIYKDPLNAPEMNKSECSCQFQAGVPCGMWVSRDILAVGEDDGCLLWLSTSADPGKLTQEKISFDHTNAILSLAKTGEKLVTASADCSVFVYDIERQQRVMMYKPAHSEACHSVAGHPSQPTVFATASLDGNVLLWDTRQEKPASGVYRDAMCPTTCVLWQPETSSSNTDADVTRASSEDTSTASISPDAKLLLGTIDGKVQLLDTKTRSVVTSSQVLRRQVHAMRHRPDQPTQVAVCGNEETVKVIHIAEEITVKYSGEQHTDLVRDVLWLDSDTFLSCAWDCKVCKHTISA